ncbi:MAG TPA: FHA domain-containing protein [Isosphaeraceae bacterium]|jgi:pSer/pThr/pTyr-binding forkhead associated (FHA) protein
MPTRLIALYAGPEILVDATPVLVGRHPRCDVRLSSPKVSQRHCCLTEAGGEVIVRDLGSTNGILINGRRVESGYLRPGDELSISLFRYRVGERRDDETTPAGDRGRRQVGKLAFSS